METAKTCEDFSAAYKKLTEAFKNLTEHTVEEYFDTPEAKADLEKILQEIHKRNP